MRNTLATLDSIAASSQRPWLASCCARPTAWNRPASASTRGSFMARVSSTSVTCTKREEAAKRRIGGCDHGAAQAGLAVVEHGRLALRHGPLRLIEAHLQAAVRDMNLARLVRLAVTGLGGTAERRCRRPSGHPVRRFGKQACRLQPVVVAALRYVKHVRRHVLANHV